MTIPNLEIQQLTDMVHDFIRCDLPRKRQAALKGRITRKLNQLGRKYGVVVSRETGLGVVQLLKQEIRGDDSWRLVLWINRLTVGSLYYEGDHTFGWYEPECQVQAEELPVGWNSGKMVVDFYGMFLEKELWESRGFYEPLPMPWTYYEDARLLQVTYKRFCKPETWWWYWACWGYALAERIPYTVYEDRLEVDRSLKEFGWWTAYKWWSGCQDWYRDKHPDWFEE